jgi:hypothetical protein
MRQELEDKLFNKYPKIFRQKDLDMTQTCLCWGIETPDQWYDMIDALCRQLQWDIDHNDYPQIEATQVKEKYGTLRFYYNQIEDGKPEKIGVQDGMISFVESICHEFKKIDS